MVSKKDLKRMRYGQEIYVKDEYGAVGRRVRWRINGMPKTWKRNPDRVEVPIKHGLYDYGTLTMTNRDEFALKDKKRPKSPPRARKPSPYKPRPPRAPRPKAKSKRRGSRKSKASTHKVYKDPRPDGTLRFVKFGGQASPIVHIYKSKSRAQMNRRSYGSRDNKQTSFRVVKAEGGWALLQIRKGKDQYYRRSSWLDKRQRK